jgi:uncharacterized protein YecE (DUF72 family)
MARFFDLLPHDTSAALRLARKRDARLKGRARLAIDEQRPLRHAVEIRHESFVDASFFELLRERNIALVIAETAKRWPMPLDITADFVYMRLHGDKELYRSGYSSKALDRWADRIRKWSRLREVYCYFDNTDVKLRAPVDAQTLMRKLGLPRGSGISLTGSRQFAAYRRTSDAHRPP